MLKNSKKVLIITCHFPPDAAIGARRLYGLAKYIKNFGWEPYVLTIKMPRDNHDEFNIIEVDYPGNIYDLAQFAFNTHFPEDNFFWRLIEYPDRHKNIEKRMYRAADEFLKNNKIDAVITSSRPETLQLVGKRIKDKYKLPWLADMRDLWTKCTLVKPHFIRDIYEEIHEKNTLKKADTITTVSKPLADLQREFLEGRDVEVIHNGFDPEEVFTEEIETHDKFTLLYTGHLYPRKYWNLEYLFNALSELINENSIDRDKISVKYYGFVKQNISEIAEKYDIQDVVGFYGKIPREQALIEQKKSHILLHYQCEDKAYSGNYGGKIFEYLSMKRPVLVTGGHKDVLWELLDQTKAGMHALTKQEIKSFILKHYNEWVKTGKVSYNAIPEEVDKYSYRAMASKFAGILDRITG